MVSYVHPQNAQSVQISNVSSWQASRPTIAFSTLTSLPRQTLTRGDQRSPGKYSDFTQTTEGQALLRYGTFTTLFPRRSRSLPSIHLRLGIVAGRWELVTFKYQCTL